MTAASPRRPETIAVTAGRPAAAPGQPLNVPLVLASNFRAGSPDAPVTEYSRDGGTATWHALEAAVGALEGGTAVAFASGMGAATALLDLVPVGARVVVPTDSYSGVRALLFDGAAHGRWQVDQVDITDTATTIRTVGTVGPFDTVDTVGGGEGVATDGLEGAGGGGAADGGDGVGTVRPADLLWLESPTNPLIDVADLAALCRAGRDAGALVVVDNTFATPLGQQPLALGADLVLHSATKFIGGHSDLLTGIAVAGNAELAARLVRRRQLAGATPGALEAFLALRGLRTLPVRLARAQESAGVLAERLLDHPAIERVRYPGLADDPGHALAARQMNGFGAMLSFEVRGGAAAADAVCGALRVVTNATSLGGVESTIERRSKLAGQEHIPPGLLRFSVGVEHVEDLWDDLSAALSAR